MMNHLIETFGRVGAALAVVGALGLGGAAGCGKPDPDENFRLWMNNEAGWDELAKYVSDKNNDAKSRVRALEILVAEGGQPSQVLRVVEKAPDRVDLLIALQPLMFKLFEAGPKKQGHGKRVLFDMIKEGNLPPAKVAELKAGLAKWAFGDLTPETPAKVVVERLSGRVTGEEIELLGSDAIKGAEIMLSLGVQKTDIVVFLKNLKSPDANRALIAGIKRYQAGKNVKISEEDLGTIQATDSIEGFQYFLELYLQHHDAKHPDDKRAAAMAIQVAIQWEAVDANKPKVKAAWAAIGPLVEKLLVMQNCDDRWLATQWMAAHGGLDGFKGAFTKLPDDDFYGKGEPYGVNDVKLEITRICNDFVKPIGADALRPILEPALKTSPRMIERVLAARCLLALGDPASVAALKAFDKKDPMGLKTVQPIVNVPNALTLFDLVAIAAEVADYVAGTDKQAAEGKLDPTIAKYIKIYAGFGFDRRGKEMAAFAEEEAKAKFDKEKAGKAAAPAPPAAPPAAAPPAAK